MFNSSASNDQIVLFHNLFLNPLKEKLEGLYKEKVPAITMVMVNVKSNERFFTDHEQARNVPAGTVIASDVVSNLYDFYVVSQNSNKGSTVPNYYRVIFSDSKL